MAPPESGGGGGPYLYPLFFSFLFFFFLVSKVRPRAAFFLGLMLFLYSKTWSKTLNFWQKPKAWNRRSKGPGVKIWIFETSQNFPRIRIFPLARIDYILTRTHPCVFTKGNGFHLKETWFPLMETSFHLKETWLPLRETSFSPKGNLISANGNFLSPKGNLISARGNFLSCDFFEGWFFEG